MGCSKMSRLSCFIFWCIFLHISVAIAQNTVGTINNTESAFNGYTLFTNHTKTFLINNCGEVINQWNSNYIDGKSVYLLEDGSILRCGFLPNPNFGLPGIGGVIQKISWEGVVLWEYTYSSSSFSQHHDVYPLPNGNVLILAATKKTQTEAIQAGRNPSLLTESGLYNEQIIEVEPTGLNSGTIIWEWNVWDHLIQEFDSTKSNFGIVSENPQLLDINYLGFAGNGPNWLHANSIQYNEILDEIIISVRQLNEIYIIDHSTTLAESTAHTGGNHDKGGDFLYRWGNPLAYQQGSLNDQKLFGQHTPHWIPDNYVDGGKILIFNNGNWRFPEYSSLAVINPEKNVDNDYLYVPNAAYGPESPDWQYEGLPQTDFFSRIMSSAQRLPNGNTLICDADSGYVFEIDSNNNKVWEYINPQTVAGTIFSQGDIAESNLIFRAFKYAPNYAAFDGRDLTPGNPIELNPDLSQCNLLNIDEVSLGDFQIFPNPTSGIINFKTKQSIEKIEVYSTLGSLAATHYNVHFIDLNPLRAGVYILKIYSNNTVFNQKVLKR